ncbi:hypothetical protein ACFFX0_17695 [Citricoccus parietis]|uniref:Secreted protein n=1 Tax=Citricoccus parietis TaxID=592307 RepID=A0ABV5G1X3_9MICC
MSLAGASMVRVTVCFFSPCAVSFIVMLHPKHVRRPTFKGSGAPTGQSDRSIGASRTSHTERSAGAVAGPPRPTAGWPAGSCCR